MNSTLEDSVVLITSSNPKYKDVIGTGFVIYREAETTYLLTCAHVVEDVGGKDSVKIYSQLATVIASSDVNDFDLAVLQVKHEKLINRPVLRLQHFGKEGTSVKAAGYYLYSKEKKRSLATIQGVLGTQKYREDQDTGERAIVWEVNINNEDQLQKGYSGSPVVDLDSGFVIGVVTNMGTGGQKGEIISVQALEIIYPSLIEKIKGIEKIKDGYDEEKGIRRVKPNLENIEPQKARVSRKKEKEEKEVEVSNPLFSKLEEYLNNEQWREADKETTRLILEIGDKDDKGSLNVKDCRNFPKEELRDIDRLWLKYSKNHFGLSVQKEIVYPRKGGKLDDYDWHAYEKMSEEIGWRQGGEWLRYDDYTFNTNAPKGHLPSLFMIVLNEGDDVIDAEFWDLSDPVIRVEYERRGGEKGAEERRAGYKFDLLSRL